MSRSSSTLSVVTRLSRSDQYLQRVLDGLLLQTQFKLQWVIVTQHPLNQKHQSCLNRARQNGIDVIIKKAKRDLPLGRLANIGVRASVSEFVLLHDDDDALRGDFTRRAKPLFNNPDTVAVVCQAAILHENKKKTKLHFVLSPGRHEVMPSSLAHDNLIVTNALIYRRKYYEIIGGYPENVAVAEDWLFNQKLAEQGKIKIIPNVFATVFVRQLTLKNSRDANTDRSSHLQMAEQIRRYANGTPPKLVVTQRSWKQRTVRLIDRICFRIGGWFLPRL